MPLKKIEFRSMLAGSKFTLEVDINDSLRTLFERIARDATLCKNLTNKPGDLDKMLENGFDPATSKFSVFHYNGSRIPLNDMEKPIIEQIPPDIKQMDTFELVYAVAGIVASAENLQLQAFASVTRNFFDGRFDVSLEAAPAHAPLKITPAHNIVLRIKQFPVFGPPGKRRTFGDIMLCLPRHTCYVKKNGAMSFEVIQQKHVNLWCDRPSQGFPHPHVYDSGEPCLNGAAIATLVDMFDWLVPTLMLTNVTDKSITIGHLASLCFGKEACRDNLLQHRDYLKSELGENVFLRDRLYILDYFSDCYPLVLENML